MTVSIHMLAQLRKKPTGPTLHSERGRTLLLCELYLSAGISRHWHTAQ